MTAKRAATIVLLLVAAAVAWLALRPRPTTDIAPTPTPPPAAPTSPPPRTPTKPRHVDDAPAPAATPDAPPATPASESDVVHVRCVFKDGRPAPGARVRAWAIRRLWNGDDDGRIGDELVAPDDGRLDLRGVATGGQIVVYAALPGFQTAGAVPKVETLPMDVTLTFGEGGVLTGRVVGPWGKPVAGAEVRLRPADRKAHGRDSKDWRIWSEPGIWEFYAPTTTTDADGAYRIVGAPLPRNGATQARVPVARAADKFWRGDDVAFETDGQELVRDIRVGGKEWFDEPFEAAPKSPVAPRRVAGRVVDVDGKPVVGARVGYFAGDGPRNFTWTSVSTDAEGRFEADLGSDNAHGRTVEVRVGAKGFRRRRCSPTGDETIVRLERETRPPLPGRVRGLATDKDGKPISGAITVHGMDESLAMQTQRTIADAGGSFVLEGVQAGDWRFFLTWSDDWTDAAVLDGAETRIELRAAADAASFAPKPWTKETEAELEELRAKTAELAEMRHEVEKRGGSTRDIDKELFPAFARRDELDAARLATLPRRTVVVAGLPKDAGVVVRATFGNETWRAEAQNGAARFASLSVGKWTLTVERPGADDAARDVEIVEGDGAQAIEFNPSK